jgi:hypothetical protein
MSRHRNLSYAAIAALVVALVACSSSNNNATTTNAPTTSLRGTPALTLPGLVAPPRSLRAVFTGEAAQVETAFRALLDAYNRKDIAAIRAAQAKPGTTAELRSFVNSYRIRLFRINDISLYGNQATIDYENAIVGRNVKPGATTTLLGQQDLWTKQGGHWKEASDRAFTPGIPQDLKTVTLTLRDGAPTVVPAGLPDADFAFLLKNTGRKPKGAFILGVPADLPVARAAAVVAAVGAARGTAGTEFPDGIVEMGATADVAGHRNGTMVFSRRLPPGRYLLFSRAAGDGDVLPNEVGDFTVK